MTIMYSLLNPGDVVQSGTFVENYRGYGLYIHTAGTFEGTATIEIRPGFDNTTWTLRTGAEAHIDQHCVVKPTDCAGGGGTGYACSNCSSSTTCTPGTSGCYSTPSECTTQCPTGGGGNYSCINNCTTPITCIPGITSGCYASQTDCATKCASQTCFFGSCYNKNTVIMAVGGFFVFMMMMRTMR